MEPLRNLSILKKKERQSLSYLIIQFVIGLLLVLLSVHNGLALDVTLAWDPNDQSENVTEYRMYYWSKSWCETCDAEETKERQSRKVIKVTELPDAGNPEYTLPGLRDETLYCFSVKAYNGTESGPSNVVTFPQTIMDVPASNEPPDRPFISYPSDGQNETEVPLTLITDPFSDPDDDSHKQSHWQISEQRDFSSLVLNAVTDNHLTTLPVPHMVLKPNHTYYARVHFYDFYCATSEWSDPVEFTTTYYVIDTNEDGVPDEWEVDSTVDFNLNGIPDIFEPETIKCVRASDGSVNIGVEKISDSITEIEALDAVDPADIPDALERPSDIIYGLFSYRLILNQPGAVARVRVYFSAGVYSTDNFFKYDTINGWYDYSQYTTFNDDGQSVILELTDGGYGDSDGVANGIITDPGGLSSGASYVSTGGDASGGERMGCFVATATYGSPLESHVSILKDFRDTYLVHCSIGRMIVRTYYKYSPDLALFIEKHEFLKSLVSLSLIPVIAFSYLALHFGFLLAVTIIFVGLMLSTILMAVLFRRTALYA